MERTDTPDRVQLNAWVDRRDREQFKAVVKAEGRTVSGTVRLLIRDWVSQREAA